MKKAITILSIFLFSVIGGKNAQAQNSEKVTDKEITCFYMAANYIVKVNLNAYAVMSQKARALQTSGQRIYDIFMADNEGKMPDDITELERKDYLSVKSEFTRIENERKRAKSDYFEDSWMTECLSESRFDYIFEKAKKDSTLAGRIRKVGEENQKD